MNEIERIYLETDDVLLHQNERCKNGNTNVRDKNFQNTLQVPEDFSDTIKLSDY